MEEDQVYLVPFSANAAPALTYDMVRFLKRPQIPLGRLDRGVAEQDLGPPFSTFLQAKE